MIKSKKVIVKADMIEGLHSLAAMPDLPSKIRILEDARGVKVRFSKDEVPEIVDELHKNAPNFTLVKHAVLLDNAKNTAFGILIEKRNKADNYQIEIFSTEESALNWLNA